MLVNDVCVLMCLLTEFSNFSCKYALKILTSFPVTFCDEKEEKRRVKPRKGRDFFLFHFDFVHEYTRVSA
jgi:hypothetical protein